MDKQKIANDFSRAARQYDQHAWLPQEVGGRLLGLLGKRQKIPPRVLDIGCGTGALTVALGKRFKPAQLFGFDFAPGMIEVARERAGRNGEFFFLADLESLPFKQGSFALVISNLVYQRISDLKGAFKKVNNILAPGGKFYLSLMTEGSLKELQQSFAAAARKILKVRPQEDYRHPDGERIVEDLKQAGFRIIKFKEYRRKRYYRRAQDIIRWLKSIGANYYYQRWIKGLDSRRMLEEIERQYKMGFGRQGRIPATFKAVIIAAEKTRSKH